MNQLNVSLQHSILTLAGHGWSARRIARELDLNRETVGKYLRLARSKPAISTAGSAPDSFSKPAISTLGSADGPAAEPAISIPGFPAGRQSLCQPFAQQIEAAAAVGLSAQRIYQDLVSEHGFAGSYQAVKRFVRQWRRSQSAPFVRMEVEPGAEAQVDFGQGAWVVVDRTLTRRDGSCSELQSSAARDAIGVQSASGGWRHLPCSSGQDRQFPG